jgi:hypothetical protein
MFDIFYSGIKPNLFAHEQECLGIEHAQKLSRTRFFWIVDYLTDYSDFDFLWEPAPWQADYTHVWPSQWDQYYGAYLVPKSTKNFEFHIHTRTLWSKQFQQNYKTLIPATFNYAWLPHPWEPPYIYVFGNQHYPGTIMPTVEYHMPGAIERKFVDDISAQLLPSRDNWEILEPIDEEAWDWTWRPDPTEPAYIYVFGNQWNSPEFKASVRYSVPGATDVKYMDRRTRRLPQPERFRHNLAVAKFDYSWEPNPFDPPMTYVFGNQWNPAVLEPTVIYTTGGTEIKYVDDIVATVAQDRVAWKLLDDIESFDYSWRPNPTDPPYTYVFGNQWLTPEQRPALSYAVPGATEIKYMSEPRARRVGNSDLFVQLYPCEFDWSWEPDPGSPPYVYVFGNQYYSAEVMPTVEYHMPGATERKYMDIPAQLHPNTAGPWKTIHESDWDYTWQPEPGSPPYIYVFGNQWWPAEKMPTVEYHMSGATEHKYMPGLVGNLPVDMTRWHIPLSVDVRDMDFSWVPDPGEPPYIYQFATQHQKTGGPQYRVPGATEVKYLDMMRAEVSKEAVPIFEIDHLDGNAGQIANTVRKVRYFDNYRDTLIRLAKNLKGEYEHVWVCSSVCDYTNFDFSWHPEIWQSTMLHVFPSDGEKFGDTFYMHVPTFAERAEKKELLEWYSVNYVARRNVPRRHLPLITHAYDTHVEAVKTVIWDGPLAVFTTGKQVEKVPAVPLWREKTKTIVPLSSGASQVIVPKTAVPYIKTQLYDYPHIDRSQRHLHNELPLDIVFIDNGESMAEYNWLQLPHVTIPNRIHRSSGVDGRVAAYHAAARLSTTPWFFAVFAKLVVSETFDWSWQPDRMQEPKHYIFHARNPANGLEYGHQAMIAYNRELMLNNPGVGLDFTLDSAHEVVPIMSGTAEYLHTPWMAWRTAFRECIKLRSSDDVESRYRLDKWLNNHGAVKNGEWSIYGAQDAVEYWESVNGELTELRRSYDWEWLATYAMIRRNLTPDQ